METSTTPGTTGPATTGSAGLVDAALFLTVTDRLHAGRDRLAAAGLDPGRRGDLHARLRAIAGLAVSSLAGASAELDRWERDLTVAGEE